ncbi:13824_t:CDS:1, partial [Gigaspora rosea]
MYTNIRRFLYTCDACQRRGKNLAKPPLHPISIEAPFFKIGIDIVSPLPNTPRGNRYIVVATDYMTKWPEARAIKNTNAQE